MLAGGLFDQGSNSLKIREIIILRLVLYAMPNTNGKFTLKLCNKSPTLISMPAAEYLSHWRLTLLQNLLMTGKPVTSAAFEVGYESPSAMARVFRQKFGLSPTEWLNQQQAK